MNKCMKKLRASFWMVFFVIAPCYTIFAIWSLSPLNPYDRPQIYNMKLIDRWDDSYGFKGSVVQSYKGWWKEEKSGNVIVLTISSYQMHRMRLGEVIPMKFNPTRLGLIEKQDNRYVLFPVLWLGIVAAWAIGIAFAILLNGGRKKGQTWKEWFTE